MTNTNTKNTNMIKGPGRGPMWKWGLIRVQHRLEPKARKPRSQPWQRRITKWILRDNEQLSCDSELAFFFLTWHTDDWDAPMPRLVSSNHSNVWKTRSELVFHSCLHFFEEINIWTDEVQKGNHLSALPCPCTRTLKQEDFVVGRTSVVALHNLVICYTTALWVCTIHYSWVGHCYAH